MPVPLSILVQTGTTPTDIRGRISSYEHTISDRFGFESCRITFSATLEEAVDWLQNGLMRDLKAYSPDGINVWEGFLKTVTVKAGQKNASVSMDDVANRVRCKYTTVLNTPGTTNAVSNTVSQALYGATKDRVVPLNNSTTTAAANRAASVLSRVAFARSSQPSEASTGDTGDVQVDLMFAGRYDILDWLVTSNSTTSTAVTTDQVATLLTAYIATNNLFSDAAYNIEASGISDTQFIEPETTYKQKIEALLSQGNSSNQPLTWGFYENGVFDVTTWVGAAPTGYDYIENASEGVVRTREGIIVDPWLVRPNTMSVVADLMDAGPPVGAVDAASRKYVGRVTCSISGDKIGCTLEPSDVSSVDALIATFR